MIIIMISKFYKCHFKAKRRALALELLHFLRQMTLQKLNGDSHTAPKLLLKSYCGPLLKEIVHACCTCSENGHWLVASATCNIGCQLSLSLATHSQKPFALRWSPTVWSRFRLRMFYNSKDVRSLSVVDYRFCL